MHIPFSRTAAQRRFAWLLWLALLLPVAQAAASWHALSHTRPDARGDAAGKQALHSTHCDLCLTAAAVTGGALPGARQALMHPAAGHALPQTAFGGEWRASAALAYRSRAPPIAAL